MKSKMKVYPPSFFFDGYYLEMAKAIEKNDIKLLKRLASKQDLTINLMDDKKGFNVFWYAFVYKKFDAMRALIEMGLEPGNQAAKDFGIALDFFVWQEDTRFFKAVLDGGLSPNYKYKTYKPIFMDTVSSWAGYADTKLLLAYGADINMLNSSNETPLYSTIFNKTVLGLDIACYLIEQGAEINLYDVLGYSAANLILNDIQDLDNPRIYFSSEAPAKLFKVRNLMIAKGVKWPPQSQKEVKAQMELHGDKDVPLHGYDNYKYVRELNTKKAHFITADARNEKLIDNININYNMLRHFRRNIQSLLGKYYYQGVLIEHLSMQNLLNIDYREDFFRFLNELRSENYEIIPPLLFSMFLIIKIEQNQDSTAFYLLNEMAKDKNLTYLGIYKLHFYILELFFRNRAFFVKQAHKYQDGSLINFNMSMLYKDLLKESIFADKKIHKIELEISDDNKIETNLSKRQLFAQIYYELSQYVGDINMLLNYALYPRGEISYSFYNKKKERYKFIVLDLGAYFGSELLEQLSKEERISYIKYIYDNLKKYIIRNYHVNSKRSYAHLRESPHDEAPILKTIANDEYVCFLDDAEDGWVKVYYPTLPSGSESSESTTESTTNGIEGYIHTSQLEER